MRFILFFPFLLLFIGISHSFANDRQVHLDIVPLQSHAVPGESFTIALTQAIADGWHTYWVNPGDAGQPIDIYWSTPDGVNVSDLRFPTPKKIQYETLTDYGYKNEAIYTAQVSVSDNFSKDMVTLSGSAVMLVCKDICIPVKQDVSIVIPVKSSPATPVSQDIASKAKQLFPIPVMWENKLEKNNNNIVLTLFPPQELHNQFTDIQIYPFDNGVLKNDGTPITDIRNDRVIITHEAGDRTFLELPKTRFIVETSNETYLIEAKPKMSMNLSGIFDGNILVILLFAFIGGLILNLMPCVFPVLSMKALGLVKLSGEDRCHVKLSGMSYTAGIIISMWVLAGLLIVLKSFGAEIGWGFQLQNPFVTFGLASMFVLLALNFWGSFHFTGRFTSFGSGLTTGNNARSSFFTGVLAMLVSTPCSAPFMATAIGFALTQNAAIALIVFSMLGLGLAFPYLLLCFVPQTQKILPKPGGWMDTFKRILAIPMILSAVWLFWVFAQQVQIFKSDENIPSFNRIELMDTLDQNPDKPVFVNMTAAWCITCIVNEKTSLSSNNVVKLFKDHDVIYIKGDWTNYDAEITAYLQEFDRDGVPLYVYYGPVDVKGMRPDPVLLPQILTSSIVVETIMKKEND
jgi:DsbC/DsbD-like thiol-disulfide interchange protein/cytochrome c biogenesis protein CcdA